MNIDKQKNESTSYKKISSGALSKTKIKFCYFLISKANIFKLKKRELKIKSLRSK